MATFRLRQVSLHNAFIKTSTERPKTKSQVKLTNSDANTVRNFEFPSQDLNRCQRGVGDQERHRHRQENFPWRVSQFRETDVDDDGDDEADDGDDHGRRKDGLTSGAALI